MVATQASNFYIFFDFFGISEVIGVIV